MLNQDLIKAAETASSTWELESNIKRILGTDEVGVANALWELQRAGHFDMALDTGYWYRASHGSFDASDVIDLINRWDLSQEPSALPLFNDSLDSLVRALDDLQTQALINAAPTLESPRREGLYFTLAAEDVTPIEDIPDNILDMATAAFVVQAEYEYSARDMLAFLEKYPEQDRFASLLRAAEGAEKVQPYACGVVLPHASKAQRASMIAKIEWSYSADALEHIEPYIGGLAEQLEAMYDAALTANPQQAGRYVVLAALDHVRSGTQLATRLHVPLCDAVTDGGYGGFHETLSPEAFSVLPIGTREGVVLRDPDEPDWRLLGHVKTDKVAVAAVTCINSKTTSWWASGNAGKALINLGGVAVPALIAGLDGPPAKYSELVARALVEARDPRATETFVALLDSSKKPLREAAVDGLVGLGAGVEASLEAAVLKGKKRLREHAIRVLSSLPTSDAVRALATQALQKEKSADLETALERIAGGAEASGVPDGLAELRSRISGVDTAIREAIIARLNSERNVGDWEDLAETHRDDFLVVALEYFVSRTAQERYVYYLRNFWANVLEHFGGDSTLGLWAGADALARMESRHQSEGEWLGSVWQKVHKERAREAARWYLTQEDPGAFRMAFYQAMAVGEESRAAEGDAAVFVAGLGDKSNGIREFCRRALAGSGQAVLAPVLEMLDARKADIRMGAAEYLAAEGIADALAAIEKRLEKEKSNKVIEALQTAANACGGGGQALADQMDDLDDAALDKALCGEMSKRLPPWLKAAELPVVRWQSGPAVSTDALAWLVGQLSVDVDDWDPALRPVRARIDDEDAHALLRHIQTEFEANGRKKDRRWVLYAVAILGTDDAVEAFGPGMDDEARSGGSTWAFHKINILRMLGTTAAITWLDHWARKAKSRGLRGRADEALAQLAADLGISKDEVAERALPTLGFDADGSQELEYGVRGTLTLRLTSDDGVQIFDGEKLLKSAPAARKDDDKEAIKAVKARIAAIKKSLKQHARSQVERLERAMTGGRTWTVDAWRSFFLEHPLVHTLATTLLYQHLDGDEQTLFFLSDENELLDLDLEPVTLTGQVRIPHPVSLSADDLEGWQEVFADAELVQVFPQLHRACHPLPTDDKARPFYEVLKSAEPVSPLQMLGALDRAGFERGEAEDAGVVSEGHRWFGATYVLVVHEGWYIGDARWGDDISITDVYFFADASNRWRTDNALPWSRVDPVAFSETMALVLRLHGN